MNYFNTSDVAETTQTSFSISHENGVVKMTFTDTGYSLIDDSDYIDKFAFKLLSFAPNNVLMCGLGLGTIAEWLVRNRNCSIDVIENNNELITWTNNNNHLNPKINIIEADAINYTPTKKYDLIIVDVYWLEETSRIENEYQSYIDNYKSHLSNWGVIYLPIKTMALNSNEEIV